MKKALIISNLTKRFQPGHYSMIDPLRELGYEVHWAANFKEYKENLDNVPIKIHQIDFDRNPFNFQNIIAYNQLNRLLINEKYDLIHCNSPIGGVLGRICGKKNRTKNIIYTAHGFHFYKGAPLVNNIYKLVEHMLGRYTDCIITMNKEDFENSKKIKLKDNLDKRYYINGIGIQTEKFLIENFNRKAKRKELGFKEEDFILIAMGDLIKRKNFEDSIKAIATIKNKNIHFCICGNGKLKRKLEELAKELGVIDNIHFLGFRTDISELLNMSDLFLFTTKQEGLPRAMMEAMAAGLPCIATKIRGNTDLLEKGGGYLSEIGDIDGISKNILRLIDNKNDRLKMSKINLEEINKYDISNVKKDMKKIYCEIIN